MIPIQTRQLTKHYGSFPALVDLDLDVRQGEVFGFLGPNGAGKSTTIRVLMGELNATSGSATVLGAAPREVAHRNRLGYLPADLALWPAMTGRDTLKFFANLRGGVDWRYVDQLVERLKANLDKRVGELSSGNRQKIGLIATFMHKPELLLLDEPNAGLDPLVQHEFWAMMREVADDGRSVFLSSHTLSEVERVADRVGIIRQGRLVAVEEVAALRAMQMRRIELDFDGELDEGFLRRIDGVRDVELTPGRALVDFNGDMSALLGAVTGLTTLRDLRTNDADLEEIFLAYYKDAK
ncbi:ABC transporter ATP-binding protein [Tessaracoccus sp. ZS01]|uniref:ABC transporter ATP-binding protein n=1 Tax=Tessaracoccus sp. ZS01 TaxID=1906324 RepID=UPI00096C1392|nr:ABC transporter ATP-binding protein [Tessaracoccus sp. ZS01]MCG6566744.1 ABC transporter ATP-binding protein [Tessaracoccus sp. ZS01]OMG57891.1 ABC transporter [Tessaracoccus sp. ZS01]